VVDEQDSISAAPSAHDAAFADEIDAFFAADTESPFNPRRQAPAEPFTFAAAAGPSGVGSVVGGGCLLVGATLDREVVGNFRARWCLGGAGRFPMVDLHAGIRLKTIERS
jgi:hypothetical protein